MKDARKSIHPKYSGAASVLFKYSFLRKQELIFAFQLFQMFFNSVGRVFGLITLTMKIELFQKTAQRLKPNA